MQFIPLSWHCLWFAPDGELRSTPVSKIVIAKKSCPVIVEHPENRAGRKLKRTERAKAPC
jgi:hypothetical protein